jgi:hypothetical protein
LYLFFEYLRLKQCVICALQKDWAAFAMEAYIPGYSDGNAMAGSDIMSQHAIHSALPHRRAVGAWN